MTPGILILLTIIAVEAAFILVLCVALCDGRRAMLKARHTIEQLRRGTKTREEALNERGKPV